MPRTKPILLEGERPLDAVGRLGLRALAVPPGSPKHGDAVCYFLETQGLMRIGFTRNLPGRLRDYDSYSFDAPQLEGVLLGDRVLERVLHGVFAPYREHREWFRHEGDLYLFTGDIGLAGLV